MMETQVQLDQPEQPPTEQTSAYKLPPLSLLMLIVEWAIILGVCWFSLVRFEDFNPRTKISGDEFSYLINSGAVASAIYQKSGAIPLWNPFVKTGEPLLENPFSYVLNPFMSLPVIAWGTYNGSKIAFLIHIMGLGLGGWTLGRVLRLRSAGRVFLGLALAGNGSLAGSISGGFYQMAITQTYIPWILAGVIGTLYLKRRWPVALLVIATVLQMFGGTFWYVLPAAITSGLLALFTLRIRSTRTRISFDGAVIKRLVLAGVFIVLLSMVRLLPQIAHSDYVVHPEATLGRTDSLETILSFYFNPELPAFPYQALFIFFHYAMPLWFFIAVVAVRAVVYKPFHSIITSRWRIILPLIISFVFYSLWAQEDTPFMQWLYNTFTFFKEWRFLARMMAAASPMLITLTAIWFDDIVYVAKPVVAAGRAWNVKRINVPLLRNLPALSSVIAIVMVIAGAVAALDLQQNWQRLSGLDDLSTFDIPGVTWLREQRPNEFLAVQTQGFFNYFTFWETLTRASFGNPDYRPRGDYSTLGFWAMMPGFPEWAVGFDPPYVDDTPENSYVAVEGSPAINGRLSVWRKANAVPFAALVNKTRLENTALMLDSQEMTPVSYYHQIDSIIVPVSSYPPNSVLVVQETAFPGWEVTINDQPAQFESVAELIGVVLPEPPADGSEVVVKFSYYPRTLFIGGYITMLTALLLTLYMLRADRPLRRYLPADLDTRISKRLTGTGQRVMRVLTDEKLLGSKDDDED
jgi:hypothetical protein